MNTYKYKVKVCSKEAILVLITMHRQKVCWTQNSYQDSVQHQLDHQVQLTMGKMAFLVKDLNSSN